MQDWKGRKGIPEGRKDILGVSKGLEKLGRLENVGETMWEKLEVALRFIEKNEKWIDSRWMERSSLDDQRLRKRRLENNSSNRSNEGPTEERNRSREMRDAQEIEETKRDAHQVKKAGRFMKDGNYQEDGKLELEEVHIDAEKSR